MIKIKEIKIPGYERVLEVTDPDVHLHGFIALQNTQLGPALGGLRIYPYFNREEALKDVLRLAQGMTYKSAVAEVGLGGGKSVIICPKEGKNADLFLSFAEAIHSLKGKYIVAEDVGTTLEDMVVIHKKTPYVAALPTDKSTGDPSRFTAWGVYKGIQAVCKTLWGTRSVLGKRILIQGLGNVGGKLAQLLFWEGACLAVCDTNPALSHSYAHLYGADIINLNELYKTSCDIFAPCALGAILNKNTIPLLQCSAVAGAANNQLSTPADGELLLKKEILYAPDYIINSGGLINAAAEFEPSGYNPVETRNRVNLIYDRLLRLFQESNHKSLPTSIIADHIAEYNIKHLIGKRTCSIKFK